MIETIGSEKSQNKPLGRYGHTMNYYSPANLLVVFGGQSLSGEYLNDLHFFNLGTKSWKLATSSNGLSPPGLSWHCSAIYKVYDFQLLFIYADFKTFSYFFS